MVDGFPVLLLFLALLPGMFDAQSAPGPRGDPIVALEKAVRERPEDAAALRALAAAYAAAEDPRAEETYRRAIAAVPGDLPLRVALAEFLWRVRKFDSGNEEMERVIHLAPDNPRLKAHYGVNLAEQGRFTQAAENLDAARRGGFDDADVLYYLGSALWEIGRLDEAAERLSDAVAKAPRKVSARHRLGRLLLFQGKSSAAIAQLSRATQLDPQSTEVLLDYGRALEASGDSLRAEAAYRRALELEPGASLAHYLLGTLLARAGRREEAEEHIAVYRRAFEKQQQERLRSGSRQAEINLGWTELASGQLEEAVAQFRRHPEDVEALRGAARALSRLGRHEEAVRTLERALLLEPENRLLRFEVDKERERGENK